MNGFQWLVVMVAVVLIVPCRFDPAIRIKEWMIRTGRRPESRGPDE